MSSSVHQTDRLIRLALSLGFLTEETSQTLRADAQQAGIDITRLATRDGLLSPTQLDIVETLLDPEAAVPGYRIEKVIGQGGMGVVYLATQLALNRQVALKTVLISQLAKSNAAARFEQEAVSIAQLTHPHIVAAYDFGRHRGRLHLVMEYVKGETLHDWIERSGPSEERLAVAIIRQVAAGLSAASIQGIVHRDIKPANVLLTRPPAGIPLPTGVPMAKIADFGLAMLADPKEVYEQTRLTADGAMVGSPHYMAPEQLGGETVDFHADIYGLGATLFHLLTGQAPLARLSLPQLLAKKATGFAIDLSASGTDHHPELARLIEWMMAVDPSHRPQDYTELIGALDRLIPELSPGSFGYSTPREDADAHPDLTDPTRLTTRPSSTRRLERSRRPAVRWKVVLPVAAAAVLIAATVWMLMWGNRTRGPIGGRERVDPGRVVNLFDGQTLEGWDLTRNASGGWTTDLAPDESIALTCTDRRGAIGRRLEAWDHTRISVSLWRGTATSVELHFAISGDSKEGPRMVVSLTADAIQAGRRIGDFGPLEPIGDPAPLPVAADRYLAVHVERQAQDWWIFYENDLLVTIPLDTSMPFDRVRLVIDGGTGWFSELSATELQ